VEFVIVLPVFLLIVFAAIDWGWYFVRRETAVNAVREGARVASVEPFRTDAATTQAAGLTAARAAIVSYLTGAGHPAGNPTCSRTTVGVDAAVQCDLTDYPTGPLTGLAWTLVPHTVSVRAVMRFEVQ
jgi:Flp pilus assembly protein TadG